MGNSNTSITYQRIVLFGALFLAYVLAALYVRWRHHSASLLRLAWAPRCCSACSRHSMRS